MVIPHVVFQHYFKCDLSFPLKLFTFMPSCSGRMALRKMPTRAASARPEMATVVS